MSIPTVVGPTGALPIPPATLRAELVALVAASNPGYTADLPGSLIEDISSTDVGALALIDSAQIDLVNSLTPFGANLFVLNELGLIYGVPPGQITNTSVFVVFTGTVGFTIQPGFTVSDGTNLFRVVDGGIIGSGGSTVPLFAVSINPGSFPVPANTVINLVTSVPSTIALSVINPLAGTPSAGAESVDTYRSRVLMAGLAASQGMPRYLKTLLANIPGVQPRLISVRQNEDNDAWEIIVGGTADPYQVGFAIYKALFDITDLTGSTINVTNITNDNPAVVTTDLNYGLPTSTLVTLTGVVGMTGVNGVTAAITVVDEKTFSIAIDTTGSGGYVSGGVVSPNPRNQLISIYDYPDTYAIPFVVPPEQDVSINCVWNTTALNVVSDDTIASLGSQALASYVNSVPVGQPMNLFELQTVFQASIADIIPPQLLTRMVFTVSINGIVTSPVSGTGIIAGDPESYFSCTPTAVLVQRG